MRIIGGKNRGKTISLPAKYEARPTTDFAKEGLFNIISNEYEFEGLSVLDLFGGTGSISFEFASRGAGEIHCIEMSPANAAFIRNTAKQFGFDNITVIRHNVFDFLDICKRKYDIIFADPPYAIEGLDTIPGRAIGFLSEIGTLILEHPGTYSFSSEPGFIKERKYGNVHFSFFGRRD
ncbi:hypothetical protein B5F83_01540 [Muribaculum sp. An289]|uniref:RsmD family RNA methyltransferase n=1 Tax=unclassified Muribaculum TaxID=2622126 RepID=UPI000B3AB558|nr:MULTISPECIES: RsmD family RNA methyltransferase [unclassified Muribaculum]OUO37955.1 hypothetical protein B5F83_01540 [Muribaculum sp. An289]OUO44342.1 hypothetical protein B5F81_01005 [Muribaculum sp. An287]